MRLIDADKFLTYLIFSKHIDGLTCGEVREVVEMCKVDILDKVRSEIEQEYTKLRNKSDIWNERACGLGTALEIIDKYKTESEGR